MLAVRTGREIRNIVMGVFNPLKEDWVWLRVSAVPQFERGAEHPDGVYTTFEDITEQRRAEQERDGG